MMILGLAITIAIRLQAQLPAADIVLYKAIKASGLHGVTRGGKMLGIETTAPRAPTRLPASSR